MLDVQMGKQNLLLGLIHMENPGDDTELHQLGVGAWDDHLI